MLAFPGAEGFGARATGGRGGQVIRVTSLATSGPGSLQAALDVSGPRIVVFEVSGVIPGDVTVTHGDVTIAGQTAPGGGITIGGRFFGEYDPSVQNIIIRHVRVRPPRCGSGCDASQYDAMQFSRNSNLILDHISVAYGADETIDIYDASDVTIQWSTIEASQVANHPDGHIHNYGIIQGPGARRLSFHHNLCAHHSRRCPAIANGPADVRNNVAYNVRHAFLHTNPAEGDFDFLGNYFKQGPNDTLIPYYFDDEDTSDATRTRYYLLDSYVDDPGQLVGSVDDPWSSSYFGDLFLDSSHRSTSLFAFSTAAGYVPISTQSATAAYADVLAAAGAFPRDLFTTTTVEQVQARTGAWDPPLPADLMEGLTSAAPPADTDHDGMPDAWESAHGLDPANGSDHTTVMSSGYTAIEEYINERAALLGP
ncbi:MAG: pectate lyase precursor [Deltaproteobacteria bacterium]|nr:pectate lyase precursor [Deltaproteobacteria bacterium]